MGNDMVNNRCWYRLALLLASYTQWVGGKKVLPGSLPPSVVTFFFCGLGVVIMKRCVFLTVHRAIGNEPCTTGVA